MAITYVELTQLVQDYLEDDGTTFVADLDQMIELAEARILLDVPELPEYYLVSTGVFSPSNNLLPLPNDFRSVDTFMVSNLTGTTQALLPKDSSFIREAYPTDEEGLPRYYSQFDATQLIFAPTPDVGYAYEMYYFGAPTSIVTAGTSWLGNNAEDCLLYGTLVEAYTFLKGDPDVWQAYKLLYDQSIGNLKNYANNLTKKDSFRSPSRPA